MTGRVALYGLAVCLMPALVAGQGTQAGSPERLSIDAAVRLALDNNRQIRTARLQVEKAEQELAVARTRRLPVFQAEVTASQLLTPVNFAFPRGAFGDFPGTGPIPAADTNVRVPRQPTAYVTTQVSQPISQLFRIGLGIRSAAMARDIERERVRGQQLDLVNNVKRLYFAILRTESTLAATDEAIALYRELDRTVQIQVAQKVALRSDALDVQVRLAEEELARTTQQNTLSSQKEQLNQLLGRDVRTTFEAEAASAISILEIDLDAARARALENRPDVREAQLAVAQAELDRRLTQADRIPDVTLAASYSSNFNMDILPRNLATLGVQLKWEPFDWGRKGREFAVKTHTVDQARLRVRDAEDRVIVETSSRFRALAEARARLTVAQMTQSAARERLRVGTNQYQVQAALLPDVLKLRAELAGTTDRYQQALLSFWTAKADFEHAVGEEVIR